ncbi:ATP-binding protein [Streptosporangium sp. NPDC049644]|uniref:sensor histidine kinase n=1 Tax=Streptosporangium sp. NPDC049644 TaxID=3155507 RepID=UPI003421EF55
MTPPTKPFWPGQFGSVPATARGALATIADTGSEVMAEMRRLLAVLRIDTDDGDEDGGYDPAPGLDRLHHLVERVRSAGVPMEMSITGAVRPLPPGIDLCAYRILQECLTNVLKHAGPAMAHVSLHYGADLELRVGDDGRGAPPAPQGGGPSSPHGQISASWGTGAHDTSLTGTPMQESGRSRLGRLALILHPVLATPR